MFDQGAGQHDVLVGLPGQLGQQLDGLSVVASRERLEAEHSLQLDPVLAPGLLPLPVLIPAFHPDLEMVGDQFQQRQKRWLIDPKDDAGKVQVADDWVASLPDDG